jgi:CHAT domain-containing protein
MSVTAQSGSDRASIGTLWPVTDLAARTFATRTYEALSQGNPPAQALHLATRAKHPSHPYLWAAHQHIGP